MIRFECHCWCVYVIYLFFVLSASDGFTERGGLGCTLISGVDHA